MQIVYTGPFPQVDIDEASLTVEQGKPFKVDDDLGKRLLEQEDYSEAKSTTTKEKD